MPEPVPLSTPQPNPTEVSDIEAPVAEPHPTPPVPVVTPQPEPEEINHTSMPFEALAFLRARDNRQPILFSEKNGYVGNNREVLINDIPYLIADDYYNTADTINRFAQQFDHNIGNFIPAMLDVSLLAAISLTDQLRFGRYEEYVIHTTETLADGTSQEVRYLDVAAFMEKVYMPAMMESAVALDVSLQQLLSLYMLNRGNTASIEEYNNDIEMANKQFLMATAIHLASKFPFENEYLANIDVHAVLVATAQGLPEEWVTLGSALENYIRNPFSEQAQMALAGALRGNVNYYGAQSVAQYEASRLLKPTIGINDIEPDLMAQVIVHAPLNYPDDVRQAAENTVYAYSQLKEEKKTVVRKIEEFIVAHGDVLDVFLTTDSGEAWSDIGLPHAETAEDITPEGFRQFYSLYSRLGVAAEAYDLTGSVSKDRLSLYNVAQTTVLSAFQFDETMSEAQKQQMRYQFLVDQFTNEELYRFLTDAYPELSSEIESLRQGAERLKPATHAVWTADTAMYEVLTKDGRDTDPILQTAITSSLMKTLFDNMATTFGYREGIDPPEAKEFLSSLALLTREIAPTIQLGGDMEGLPKLQHVDSVYNHQMMARTLQDLWQTMKRMNILTEETQWNFELFGSFITNFERDKHLPDDVELTGEEREELQKKLYAVAGYKGADGICFMADFIPDFSCSPDTEIRSETAVRFWELNGETIESNPLMDYNEDALYILLTSEEIDTLPERVQFMESEEGMRIIVKLGNNEPIILDAADNLNKIVLRMHDSLIAMGTIITMGSIDFNITEDAVLRNKKLSDASQKLEEKKDFIAEYSNVPEFGWWFRGLDGIEMSQSFIVNVKPQFFRDSQGTHMRLYIENGFAVPQEYVIRNIERLGSITLADDIRDIDLQKASPEQLNAAALYVDRLIGGFFPEYSFMIQEMHSGQTGNLPVYIGVREMETSPRGRLH